MILRSCKPSRENKKFFNKPRVNLSSSFEERLGQNNKLINKQSFISVDILVHLYFSEGRSLLLTELVPGL